MPFFKSMPLDAGPPNVFNKYPRSAKAWPVMSQALMNGLAAQPGRARLILAYAAGVTGCAYVCGAHSRWLCLGHPARPDRGDAEGSGDNLGRAQAQGAAAQVEAAAAPDQLSRVDADAVFASRLGRARAARRDLRHGARRLHAAPGPGPRISHAAAAGRASARHAKKRVELGYLNHLSAIRDGQ